MKEIESAKALSCLFYPKFWKDLKALLQKCEMISDSMKALEIEAIVDIEFMFANGNKQKVYCELIHAIKNGWLRVDQRKWPPIWQYTPIWPTAPISQLALIRLYIF